MLVLSWFELKIFWVLYLCLLFVIFFGLNFWVVLFEYLCFIFYLCEIVWLSYIFWLLFVIYGFWKYDGFLVWLNFIWFGFGLFFWVVICVVLWVRFFGVLILFIWVWVLMYDNLGFVKFGLVWIVWDWWVLGFVLFCVKFWVWMLLVDVCVGCLVFVVDWKDCILEWFGWGVLGWIVVLFCVIIRYVFFCCCIKFNDYIYSFYKLLLKY